MSSGETVNTSAYDYKVCFFHLGTWGTSQVLEDVVTLLFLVTLTEVHR